MKNIELHIFTNAGTFAPDTKLIESTYSSFIQTFGDFDNVFVWHDPKPNITSADLYHENLKKIFTNVEKTTCFADGYVKSVSQSKADFMFMLEHDWKFYKDNIHHGIEDICETMKRNDILHMRFNKRNNVVQAWDKTLEEITDAESNLSYCVTPSIANNPHIIYREKYISKALNYIKVPSNGQRGGVEQVLTREVDDLFGAIYGKLNHEKTIYHTDGSRNPKKELWK